VLSDQHYELRCRECPFTHGIPDRYSDAVLDYSVDPRAVKIVCRFGGRFTVTLKMKDFFTIALVPAEGVHQYLAGIADNINPIHKHLMTHHDALFLNIKQKPTETHHEFSKEPKGRTFVRYQRGGGIDIVGDINVGKAEIPGVS